MKFGSVTNPNLVNFSLPADHIDTAKCLNKTKLSKLSIYIGCAKWNKTDLKGFYPKGVKDELAYYSSQFNCIELNATFYRLFPTTTFTKWKEAVPDGFKFFPKFGQDISHWARLKDVGQAVDLFLHHISFLEEKLGMPFLQMHDNFSPKDFEKVASFIDLIPKGYPLAVEFRHTQWFNDAKIADELYKLLEERNITNVLVDSAGRRDIMHMRLTSSSAFVRYVGANHSTDYTRLDTWIDRIVTWKEQGLKDLYFFVHQNVEEASPLLSSYFIKKLNQKLGIDLHVPVMASETNTLF